MPDTPIASRALSENLQPRTFWSRVRARVFRPWMVKFCAGYIAPVGEVPPATACSRKMASSSSLLPAVI